MKALGLRPRAFIVSSHSEPLMKQEALVFDMTSQTKQYRFIQCHIFVIFLLKCCHMHNLLYLTIWYYNLCEAEALRYREPETVLKEECIADKAISTSTKYKNKWAETIFNELQTAGKCLYWIPEACLKLMICPRLDY